MGTAPHPVDDKGRLDPSFVSWMMGFPQGWTEGMTRTQALKALGNAVVPQQAEAALELLIHHGPMEWGSR
jgi:DNA (cytosine-5)-methyltransferase 1